jgi:hypothetical protein
MEMAQEIRKPANWENSTFEDLFTIEAGQAYIAEQFGGSVDSVKNFRSNRERSDACSYELFEDGSLWFHNNAQDEIWADVSDFVRELQFTGVYWEDTRDRDGFLVDAMDRNLLVHLWGEDDAREFFESAGGIVSEVDVN